MTKSIIQPSLVLFLVIALGGGQGFAQGKKKKPTPKRDYSQQIEEIKKKFDQNPYNLVAGYPTCRAVLERRMGENEAILGLIAEPFQSRMKEFQQEINEQLKEAVVGDGEFQRREKEMGVPGFSTGLHFDVNLPSGKIVKENEKFGHVPSHFYGIQKYLSKSTGGGICFKGDTNVFVPRHDRVETQEIQTIYGDNFVLSSTVAVVSDPRYQKDCWARVYGVALGEIYEDQGEKFKLLKYRAEGSEEKEILVTPDHRFMGKNPGDSNWHWIPIGSAEFKKGMQLFESCENGSTKACTVTDIGEREALSGFWDHFWNTCFGWEPDVFNVMVPETFVYYVGDSENQKVLVHNLY